MDGALLRDGDRYLLRFERHFSHPVERVWKAITEPTERSAWFPGEAAIRARRRRRGQVHPAWLRGRPRAATDARHGRRVRTTSAIRFHLG